MRVSILLICWNQSRYLDQAIGSLAAQTSRDFEIIFLDNASTDGSYETAEQLLGATGLPFQMLRNPSPLKIASNLNRLFAASSGSLVAPLACDDWYDPDYVMAMTAAHEQYPQAGIFYPSGWSYFEDEQKTQLISDTSRRNGDVLQELLRGEGPIFFVGCCYPRDVVETVGGWDESLLIEDLDFFIRVCDRHPVQHVAAAKVYYRRHSRAATSDPSFMIRGWEQYYRKYLTSGLFDARQWMSETYRAYAAIYRDGGERGKALRLLSKAIGLSPIRLQNLRTLAYVMRP